MISPPELLAAEVPAKEPLGAHLGALVGPPLHLPAELWPGARLIAGAAGAERVFGWARLFGALRLASEGPDDPLDSPRRWKLLNLMPSAS